MRFVTNGGLRRNARIELPRKRSRQTDTGVKGHAVTVGSVAPIHAIPQGT
jgi:hypothetical protein